jgi:hypothetical protein
VAWEITKYQHQDSGIAKTHFICPPLNNCSMADERDPYYFNTFLDSLTMNNTTLQLTTYLEVARGNTKYNHQDGGIPTQELG